MMTWQITFIGACMRPVLKTLIFVVPLAIIALFVSIHTNTVQAENAEEDEAFPRALKYLLPPPSPILSDPERSMDTEHVAYGAVDPDEELVQPIHYSHQLHAGELQINCEYCHSNARRSKHAGVPATEVCMNCHSQVPGVDVPGFKPGIEECTPTLDANGEPVRDVQATEDLMTLCESYINDDPIEWVRVHDVPDFVYFSHKRHVTAGVLCQECHGEVQADMTVARRVHRLYMGWCLDCHEDHPSVDENYGAEAELRRAELKDCYTCHM